MATIPIAKRNGASIASAGVVVALAVYVMLAYPLRAWMVDDAAISMAYAANWSSGHGLVSQPGMPPVEGYSNFLWVVILALLNLAGAMTGPAIKLVSLAFVALALASLNSTCKTLMPPGARLAVLILVASNSSIVSWTTSGLENSLTLLLSCELLRVVCKAHRRGADVGAAVYSGLLVAALAMNRPEGIVFAVFPSIALAESRDWRSFGIYAATIAILFGSFLAFRFATFHDWVPNTFYAKDAQSLNLRQSAVNLGTLLNGPVGSGIVLLGIGVIAHFRMKNDSRLVAPLCMMFVAAAIFALMPLDWMPDRRFGTAFVPAACIFAGIVLGNLGRRGTALLIAVVAFGTAVSAYRLSSMYRDFTMPTKVVRQTTQKFEAIAEQKGIQHASILTPDIGAALLYSNLRVYDLAGLTDRTIGRTLNSDKRRFHDYIFEQIKPTFIITHGPWAERAELDNDPRFRRDYLALEERIDTWLLSNRGIVLKSGEYVRVRA